MIAVFFIFAAATAHGAEDISSAVETPSIKSWLAQRAATGDWNGARKQLKEQGVTISSNFVTDINGNPVGCRIPKSRASTGF